MITQRVLIVDADADTAEMMAYILACRYVVLIAPSRLAGMKAVFSFSPDAIVAEYFMAGISLSDFVNAVKKLDTTTNILLTSATIGLEAVAAAHQLHHLAKPFHPNRLLTTVARSMIPKTQTLELAV